MNKSNVTDCESPPPSPPSNSADPGFAAVQQFLLYGLSLPERMLRSTTAIVGGAVRESAGLLVPQAFRSSKTYSIFIEQSLNFLLQNVGGVEGKTATADATPGDSGNATQPAVENFVARKAVGNFVELAGIATLHLSPLTVLAIVSDIAYGSKTYLNELSDELKRTGVIDEKTTIDHASDLLEAVSHAAGVTAQAFDTPPLSVDGLKQTIQQTRDAVSQVDALALLPQGEVNRLWSEMRQLADREGVSLLQLSSGMTMYTLDKIGGAGRGAISTVTVAGNMFDRHILSHYAEALIRIKDQGFYSLVAESSRPYLEATWKNFSTERTTVTEELMSGRLIGKAWNGVRGWLGGSSKCSAEQVADNAAESKEPKGPE